MLRIGVLISGSGTNLQAIIDSIESKRLKNVSIVTVISNNKNAYGLVRANNYGIDNKVISPKDFSNKDEFSRCLKDYFIEKKVDLVVLAGYLVVLNDIFLEAFSNKTINIHPSLIPSFCGAGYYGINVHEAVLYRGVKITGATVHFVDSGTDTGPIILQKAVPVLPNDTPETLQKRVLEEAEWEILPKAINLIASNKIKINDNKVIILE